MLTRFQELLEKKGDHWAEGHLKAQPILVAYSGGADSTCLLHMLWKLGYDVSAGHLFHGQRAEGLEEMDRCKRFCEGLGIPFYSGTADVPQLSQSQKVSLEEAGRLARYQFLQALVQEENIRWIATGHTMSDQAETVLFHLIRGAGMKGLAGIPDRRDNIIRPLLDFSRSETREYCQREGLWFHDDPANSDCQNARTKIRLEVMPQLEMINHAAVNHIVQAAQSLREEDCFLDELALHALADSAIPDQDWSFLTHGHELLLSTDRLRELYPVIRKRLVRSAVQSLGGELSRIQTDLLSEGIERGGKGSITEDRAHINCVWNADSLCIFKPCLDLINRQPLMASHSDRRWIIKVDHQGEEISISKQSNVCTIDEAALIGNLEIRPASDGGKMVPIGMSGHKRVSDILQESGMTSTARSRLPIIWDGDGPIWVPFCRVADRVKVTDGTRKVLRLALEPLGE